MTERKIIPDGVYFGLPDAEYHDAFAMSSHGVRNIRASTLDWWARSRLNPDYEDEKTEAQVIGRAYDCRIIEGRDVFYSRYAPEIQPSDFPSALRTVEDLKRRLSEKGLPVSGTKDVLTKRLVDSDINEGRNIWEFIASAYGAEHVGKEFLGRDLLHKIEIAAAMIERHPVLCKAFTGGLPKVAVFWTDAEFKVPCKAQFDYIKPKAIVDLKTLAEGLIPFDRAIALAINSYGYDIQCAHYLDAREQARRLIGGGGAAGFRDEHRGFLETLRASDECTFLFVWQKKGVAPVARGTILRECTRLDIARNKIAEAKALFRRCIDTFGPDEPWVDIADISEIDPLSIPTWFND